MIFCRGGAAEKKGSMWGEVYINEENLLLVPLRPRRLRRGAWRLEPLVLLAARAALGVVAREPRVLGRDLRVNARKRGP